MLSICKFEFEEAPHPSRKMSVRHLMLEVPGCIPDLPSSPYHPSSSWCLGCSGQSSRCPSRLLSFPHIPHPASRLILPALPTAVVRIGPLLTSSTSTPLVHSHHHPVAQTLAAAPQLISLRLPLIPCSLFSAQQPEGA